MKIISNGKKYIRVESDEVVISASWSDNLGDNTSGWLIQKLKKGMPFWSREYVEIKKRRTGVKRFLKERENLII